MRTAIRHRNVKWIFAFYDGVVLKELYVVEAEDLENYFSKWEKKILLTGRTINNPKIATGHIKRVGAKIVLN